MISNWEQLKEINERMYTYHMLYDTIQDVIKFL